MDTLNGSNSPNNQQVTGQSSAKTCDEKLETHVTPDLFELNSQSNVGLSQKQTKVAHYQPPEPKIKNPYPVRNVDINDNFGNHRFQGAPILTASLQLNVKNYGNKKSVFNQNKSKSKKPYWPLAVVQHAPQQIKAVTVPKVKHLSRPLSQQSSENKPPTKIGTLPLVIDQTFQSIPQYQPKEQVTKKQDTGAFTALLSVENLANKYGGFKKQDQIENSPKDIGSAKSNPYSKAQSGDLSENNPLTNLNENLLAIQNLQEFMIDTMGTQSDNRRTRDPRTLRNISTFKNNKTGLKPKMVSSIPDKKLALRSVDVEESLVAGRENHIVTNALSVKGTKKTPFIGLKKRLNHNAHWSANPDNYKKRHETHVSPDQSRHSSWLYSPGLHPVLPKQTGSTNLQQNQATQESLAQTTSRTLPKQISLGLEPKIPKQVSKFEPDKISDSAIIGWFPHQSVKTPNEKKPGMKMSTYGGDKRRPREDRYFEGDETMRVSVNDRSFQKCEYSEGAVPERMASK